MNSTPTRRRDTCVATFTWTPDTTELRPCSSLPSLLDLASGDERPLHERILDHLDGDDVDRLRAAVREVHAGSDPRSVELDLVAGGAVRHLTATAVRAPSEGDGDDSVMGVVHDMTRFRHAECALEVRNAVTAALANWQAVGFDGLLGPLGTALGARAVTVWAPREAGLLPIARWHPEDETTPRIVSRPGDVVTRAWKLGLPVTAGQNELAFPVITLNGVLAVIQFRSPDGLWISDTLTRLLGAVGRELGAFFFVRPLPTGARERSPREHEVLELAAQGLSAPEIAAHLVLSPATVRSHMRNVYEKLEVGDRVSAVVKALRAGLID
jgi:DNA-binding CsgD family transcriptional regulator